VGKIGFAFSSGSPNALAKLFGRHPAGGGQQALQKSEVGGRNARSVFECAVCRDGLRRDKSNDGTKLRNRILIFLVLAAGVAYLLVRLSGRQPVAKIMAVKPVRRIWWLRFRAMEKWSDFTVRDAARNWIPLLKKCMFSKGRQ